MPDNSSSTDSLLTQIDKLLEEDDLSTKIGLRFAFSVLREAMTVVTDIHERVKTAEQGYASMSHLSDQMDDVSKKVNVMWVGYQIGIWVATIFGVSVVGLIWSLITGAAKITFAP